MENRKGFTLVEMIVVIVIIAILIAIAVPSVMKYIDDARDTNYLAEGRSVLTSSQAYVTKAKGEGKDSVLLVKENNTKVEIVSDSGNDGTLLLLEVDDKGVNVTHFVYKIKEKEKYVEYTLSKNEMKVLDEYSHNSFGNAETMLLISDIFKSVGSGIDSGAVAMNGERATKLVNELKAQGINLEELGAATWYYTGTGESARLYFSSVDISEYEKGKKVPVIMYNPNSNYFTVWSAKIDQTTTGNQTTPYNVIRSFSPYTPSTNSNDDAKTYENALKFFDQYVDAMK